MACRLHELEDRWAKATGAPALNYSRVRTPVPAPCLVLLACAVLAGAGLAHALVATLARAGLVAGAYGTYRHDTVVPVLIGALLLGGACALAVAGEAAARAAGIKDDWLSDAAERISRFSLIPTLAIAYAAQVTVLYAMESVEQIVAFGHPLGLSTSLGAPLPIALGIQLLATLAVIGLLVAIMRLIAAAAQTLGRACAPLVRRLGRSPIASFRHPQTLRLRSAGARARHPLARRIANRPPPLHSLT